MLTPSFSSDFAPFASWTAADVSAAHSYLDDPSVDVTDRLAVAKLLKQYLAALNTELEVRCRATVDLQQRAS